MADDIQKLVNDYQPSAEILEKASQIKLLATVGPTSSGKTVVAKKMIGESDKFHYVLAETSREPRPDEKNGVDYRFCSRQSIIDDLKTGQLVDVIIGPNGDLYATKLESYSMEKINIMALIPSAVIKYRELPLKWFRPVFIVPQTYELWQQWLAERAKHSAWTEEQIRGRLAEAKISYEFAVQDPGMKSVLNDHVDNAAKRLMQVVDNQPPDDEALAKETAAINLRELTKNLAENSVNLN